MDLEVLFIHRTKHPRCLSEFFPLSRLAQLLATILDHVSCISLLGGTEVSWAMPFHPLARTVLESRVALTKPNDPIPQVDNELT